MILLTENLRAQNVGRELVFSADMCYNDMGGSVFGKNHSTIILSEIARIMKNICDTFTKTQFVGATTNYMRKNRGMGFALCLCKTKAKLAIKQNDK